MPKDLLMNACGDMDITEGDAQLVSGADQVKQAWVIRMSTYLGEWFLNENIGLPYFQKILTKTISAAALKKIISDATLDTPGVILIRNIVVGEIVYATRTLNVDVYADIEGEDNALLRYTGVIPAEGCSATGSEGYPATLGDMVMWFDASDASSYEASASSIVVQNKAGAGTATGAGTAGVPTVAPGINGHPAFLFDDADGQYMEIVDTPAIRGYEAITAFMTVFIVAKPDDDGIPNNLGMLGLSGTDGGVNQLFNFGTYLDVGNDGYSVAESFEVGGSVDTEDEAFDDGEYYNATVYTFKLEMAEGLGCRFIINGVELGVNILGTESELDGGGFIGALLDTTTADTAENFFSGSIGEVLVYNTGDGEFTSEDRESVEDYLMDKWDIEVP